VSAGSWDALAFDEVLLRFAAMSKQSGAAGDADNKSAAMGEQSGAAMRNPPDGAVGKQADDTREEAEANVSRHIMSAQADAAHAADDLVGRTYAAAWDLPALSTLGAGGAFPYSLCAFPVPAVTRAS